MAKYSERWQGKNRYVLSTRITGRLLQDCQFRNNVNRLNSSEWCPNAHINGMCQIPITAMHPKDTQKSSSHRIIPILASWQSHISNQQQGEKMNYLWHTEIRHQQVASWTTLPANVLTRQKIAYCINCGRSQKGTLNVPHSEFFGKGNAPS